MALHNDGGQGLFGQLQKGLGSINDFLGSAQGIKDKFDNLTGGGGHPIVFPPAFGAGGGGVFAPPSFNPQAGPAAPPAKPGIGQDALIIGLIAVGLLFK